MRSGVKALELMWGVEERPSTWPQLEKMEMENNYLATLFQIPVDFCVETGS